MPIFSHEAPADDRNAGYRLLRTPPVAKMKAHVISHELIGCPTHFVGNRTVPCERPNCDPCDSGIGYRWHAYLLVLLDDTQETVIFEMTRKASDRFKEYQKTHGTTRGCHFQASRLNQKPNGRVLIITKTGDLTRIQLPKDQDLKKLLCHIWNIPPLQTATNQPTPAQPITNLTVDRSQPELQIDQDVPAPIKDALNHLALPKNDNGKSARPKPSKQLTPERAPRIFRD